MNKKKVLALMAMLTVTAMVTACGGKKEEAAVTETQAVESTVAESTATENTDATESTEQAIEEDTDVALAESVEETEEEMSVVEYNAEKLKKYILYPEQSIDAAKALDELGFGEIKNIKKPNSVSRNITDENGMVLEMYYSDVNEYYLKIKAEDGTVLWEWEYTDKYEIEELLASDGDVYKTGFKLVYPENTEKSIIEENTNTLSVYIFFSNQAIEVAEALDEIGFGKCVEIHNYTDHMQIKDEAGMIVNLGYKEGRVPAHSYFSCIVSEDRKNMLWELEYTDKYEIAFYEEIEKSKE